MNKSIRVKPKKRGRPATGKDPLMGFRAPPEIRASIVRWAETQPDQPSLSEAIRRLVELGLSKTSAIKPQDLSTNRKSAARAAELAAKVIDKKLPADTPAQEKAVRKRKLIQGPSVFRDSRKDRPR
jgi:hypothetical protein